jgi:hypothetical protein
MAAEFLPFRILFYCSTFTNKKTGRLPVLRGGRLRKERRSIRAAPHNSGCRITEQDVPIR